MGGQFAFLLPTMMVTVGGAFLVLWRCGFRSSLPWAVGFLSSAAGFTAPIWPSFVPGAVCGIAADSLFAIAFFAYGRGLTGEADRGLVLRIRGMILATAAGFAFLAVATRNLHLEVAANDLCCALLLGVSLVTMRPQLTDPARRVLFVVASLVELETLVRGSTTFLTLGQTAKGGFLATEYAFLMQAGAGLLGLLLAFAALGTVLFDAVARYRRDALLDPLTGLMNRRGFAEATRQVSARKSRGGAVIACDIDHFKRVNDRYGHPAGDAVISGFARMIRLGIPAGAVARRSGGEEFTIFLPGADGAEATRIANAIRADLARFDWRSDGVDEGLTASFGVAVLGVEDGPLDGAIARADQALYESKRSGRDKVSYRLQVIAFDQGTASSAAARVVPA